VSIFLTYEYHNVRFRERKAHWFVLYGEHSVYELSLNNWSTVWSNILIKAKDMNLKTWLFGHLYTVKSSGQNN